MGDTDLKPATVSLIMSSLKFYYNEVLEKNLFSRLRPPKLEKKIPIVLTKKEIANLINSCKNKKHRLLLEFLYSSGLRVSEVVVLKVEDLDFDEKIGRVRSGKGKKERYIILSDKLIVNLMNYLKDQNIDSGYVFLSKYNKPISIRQVQYIVKDSALKAGIRKRVFCHCLRSSFATHLLESGVDIRIIQELLGHSNLATTERYTKVSTEQIKKIKSPFDSI